VQSRSSFTPYDVLDGLSYFVCSSDSKSLAWQPAQSGLNAGDDHVATWEFVA
jgi:hypothetical protein